MTKCVNVRWYTLSEEVIKTMNLWNEVKALLENEITPIGYKTWIKTIKAEDVTFKLCIKVDDKVKKSMIESRYKELIEDAVLTLTGIRVSAETEVRNEEN